eukprot:g78189.t1
MFALAFFVRSAVFKARANFRSKALCILHVLFSFCGFAVLCKCINNCQGAQWNGQSKTKGQEKMSTEIGRKVCDCSQVHSMQRFVRYDGTSSLRYDDEPIIRIAPTKKSFASKHAWLIALLAATTTLCAFGLLGSVYSGRPVDYHSTFEAADSLFDDLDRFVMKDFDSRNVFASFLPGIAGLWGKPFWVFYVNRGQSIASFGRTGKDSPLLEFNPANKAYQDSTVTGFRTFIKERSQDSEVFQPLSPDGVYQPMLPEHLKHPDEPKTMRKMTVGRNEVEVEEINPTNGLVTQVRYFIIPEEDFGGLVRQLTLINNSTKERKLDVLDGLAWMQPAGVNDWALKNMGRTLEAFEGVYNIEEPTLPFYHLMDSFVDSAQIDKITVGNYVISFIEKDNTITRLPIIADPNRVFGQDTSLSDPLNFKETDDPISLTKDQVVVGRTPSAFAVAQVTIPAGERVTINSIYGYSRSLDYLKHTIEPTVTKPGYLKLKREQATVLVDTITESVNTKSASKMFDGSLKQALLDNYLRGGSPQLLGDPENPAIYHTYSRRHGDLERDYNNFVIEPQFWSQGPGNFRDVAQNRRCDVFLEPKVKDFNFRIFLALVQNDGYNPLEVKGSPFVLTLEQATNIANMAAVDADNANKLKPLLMTDGGLYLGNMFTAIEEKGIKIKKDMDRDELVRQIALVAQQEAAAGGGDMFWSDHWTYTLDLLDTFLTVFPDELENVLYNAEALPFFNNMVYPLPRTEKYMLPGGQGVPQQRVFVKRLPYEVKDMWQKDVTGQVFKVPVISKLFFLSVIKFATIDSMGMGVEMEAGRPGWLDAMNGMPGWFGSGMPETYEVLRHLRYLQEVNNKIKRDILIHSEFGTMLQRVSESLKTYQQDKNLWKYWEDVSWAREKYREATRETFMGNMVTLSTQQMAQLLPAMIAKVEEGIALANTFTADTGVPACYFMFNATGWEPLYKLNGDQYVKITGLKPMVLPLFLEGPVRAFKTLNHEEAHKLFHAVKQSTLYDKELKMYKISESLENATDQMGRTMAFAPGWLENESVWLHMAYKFYLQLLRAGLFDDFWREFRTGCTAFMDPQKYGRNPQECSSFIVSSAHPDKNLHGAGFLARLSGSTAEFLSMYFLMMAGPKPFTLDDKNQVVLELKPALPGWLFTEEGTLSFRYLGKCDITYTNNQRGHTWNMDVVRMTAIDTKNVEVIVDGPTLPNQLTLDLRAGKIKELRVQLGIASEL